MDLTQGLLYQQKVQSRFPLKLAFTKFLYKIKGIFYYSASIMDTALPKKFPLYSRLEFSEGQLHRKSGLHVLWYSSPWPNRKFGILSDCATIACNVFKSEYFYDIFPIRIMKHYRIFNQSYLFLQTEIVE